MPPSRALLRHSVTPTFDSTPLNLNTDTLDLIKRGLENSSLEDHEKVKFLNFVKENRKETASGITHQTIIDYLTENQLLGKVRVDGHSTVIFL